MTRIEILENVKLEKNRFETLEELYHLLDKQLNIVEIVEMKDDEVPQSIKESYKKFESSDKKFIDL